MARFNKMQVLDAIVSTGMVPVYYNKDVEIAKQVVKACYEGGVRAFEFTNRGDFAHEVFAELIKFATKECPELVLGVGSIVDAGTAPYTCNWVLTSLSAHCSTRKSQRFVTVAWSHIHQDAVPFRKSVSPKK